MIVLNFLSCHFVYIIIFTMLYEKMGNDIMKNVDNFVLNLILFFNVMNH
jgi:hypothetical protein